MKRLCLAVVLAIAICAAAIAKKLIDLLLKDQLLRQWETAGLK
jgi:hypothetical protein